jgi:SAM-dependent methyltransferase
LRRSIAGPIISRVSREWELIDSFLTFQLVHVAARLGIADALADGPLTGEELARAVGAEPAALTRVLRGLAAEGVLEEDGETFALTPLGEALRGLKGSILARGELYYRAAGGLLDAVRQGGIPFERVYGERFFAHLSRRPADEAAFQASMAARSEREARDVAAAYDFSAVRRLVDVGGGSGALLATILDAAPQVEGVLLDRPAAVEQARRRLAGRAECVAGDFFAAVPAGADAYLLSRVIHDWPDDDAIRILRSCRAAMAPGARLLLVEAVLPERAADAPEAIRMDLHMLILFGGRERTEREYARLLGAAGLALRRVIPTDSPSGVCVLESVPTGSPSGPASPP